MGGALWILPVSIGVFAHKEGGSWFTRDKWSVFPELALVPSEAKQIKDVKGSFNSPDWLLWWLLSNSRIISPFWEKEIPAWYFFKKHQLNKWIGAERLRREVWVSLRGLNEKEQVQRQDPVEVPQRPPLFGSLSCSEAGAALPQLNWECGSGAKRNSFPIWRVVFLSWWRGRVGKNPCGSSEARWWWSGGRWKGWLEGWRYLRHLHLWQSFSQSPGFLQ